MNRNCTARLARRRVAATGAAAVAALAALAAPAARASAQVDQAVMLIRGACALPNAALAIRPTPEGRLELRITLGGGQQRSVALARSDTDTFSASSSAASSSLPPELSFCMEPYINDVIVGLGGLPDRPTAAAPPPPPTAAAGPAAAGAYVPPQLPAMALPTPAAPPRPLLPATGELSVEAINNAATGVAMAPGLAAAPAVAASGELSLRVAGCRAAGRHVQCDVKVTNDTGKDVKLVVQGAYSKLLGEDGTQVQAAWATLGNQQGDLRYGSHQAQLSLIAGTAPVVVLNFPDVPNALTAIKRLEVSMGAQTPSGVQLQKITLADVAIQGR